MDDYNFWADLFDTFQSSPDWIKALWLIIPPGFILGLIAMLTRQRIAGKKPDTIRDGELIYSVHRTANNALEIVSHLPQPDPKPTLLLLDAPNEEPHLAQNRNTRT